MVPPALPTPADAAGTLVSAGRLTPDTRAQAERAAAAPTRGAAGPRKRTKLWPDVLLAAAACDLAARVSFLLAVPPGDITPVSISAAVALAACLLRGPLMGWGVFAGSLTTNAWTFAQLGWPAGSWTACLAAAAGSTAQALLGAWALKRAAGESSAVFASPRHVRDFALIVLAACGLAPAMRAGALSLAGQAPWAGFGQAWATGWLGDFTGVIVFAPAFAALAERRRNGCRRILHAALLSSIAAGLAVTGAALGLGPFADSGGRGGVVALQAVLSALALGGLVLASSIERRAAGA